MVGRLLQRWLSCGLVVLEGGPVALGVWGGREFAGLWGAGFGGGPECLVAALGVRGTIRCEGQTCSGRVGRISKECTVGPGTGQGSRAGMGKDHEGGCRVYWQATAWECHRPQAQIVGKGVPHAASAAAPMRRKLCHVKALQGELERRRARDCWRCCLEVANGPPAAVAAVGRVSRRAAQADAHGPMEEWARKSSKSVVAQSCTGAGAARWCKALARAQWKGLTVGGRSDKVSSWRTAAMRPRAVPGARCWVTMEWRMVVTTAAWERWGLLA